MINIKKPHILRVASLNKAATSMSMQAVNTLAVAAMERYGIHRISGYHADCDCFLIWRDGGKLHYRLDSENKAKHVFGDLPNVEVAYVADMFVFSNLPPLNNLTTFDLVLAKDGHPIEDVVGNPVKFIAHVPEAHATSQVVYMNYDGKIMTCTTSGYNGGHRVLKMKVPEDRLAYVNMYQLPFGKRRFSTLFSSEETAKSKASIAPPGWKYIATAKVEWQE